MYLLLALFPTALSKIAPSLIDNREPIHILKLLHHQNILKQKTLACNRVVCSLMGPMLMRANNERCKPDAGTGQSSGIKTEGTRQDDRIGRWQGSGSHSCESPLLPDNTKFQHNGLLKFPENMFAQSGV